MSCLLPALLVWEGVAAGREMLNSHVALRMGTGRRWQKLFPWGMAKAREQTGLIYGMQLAQLAWAH